MSHLSGRNVILVVDDEPIIRYAAVEILLSAGFSVVEATNGDHALQVLEKRRDVRIVFTDVRMPGRVDGLALANEVRRRWPAIGILITSGHVKLQDGKLPMGARFVAKPYSPENLIRVVQLLSE